MHRGQNRGSKTRKLSKKSKLNENRGGNLEILKKQGGIYEFCANRGWEKLQYASFT